MFVHKQQLSFLQKVFTFLCLRISSVRTLASNWCRLRPFKSKKKKKKDSNHEGLETQYRDRKKKGKSKRVRNRQIVVDRYGFMYRSTEDTVRCEMPFLHLMPSFSTYIYIYIGYTVFFLSFRTAWVNSDNNNTRAQLGWVMRHKKIDPKKFIFSFPFLMVHILQKQAG